MHLCFLKIHPNKGSESVDFDHLVHRGFLRHSIPGTHYNKTNELIYVISSATIWQRDMLSEISQHAICEVTTYYINRPKNDPNFSASIHYRFSKFGDQDIIFEIERNKNGFRVFNDTHKLVNINENADSFTNLPVDQTNNNLFKEVVIDYVRIRQLLSTLSLYGK